MGDVVFEVGQRWHERRSIRLLLEEQVGHQTWRATGEGSWTEDHIREFATLEAPAPKPRQRWASEKYVDVQIVDADGELAAEKCENGTVICRGSVVDVAKWLAERGYRCVSEPSASDDGTSVHYPIPPRREPDLHPLAALANAVAEISTAPTREVGRRYVDIACNEIRGERYASAIRATLVAFSSDRADYGLRPVDIMAVIDACRVWEFNRSQLPFPNRKLTPAEVEQIIKPTHLAAYARLSWARATVVAHLVADVYERARTVC